MQPDNLVSLGYTILYSIQCFLPSVVRCLRTLFVVVWRQFETPEKSWQKDKKTSTSSTQPSLYSHSVCKNIIENEKVHSSMK